MSKPKPGTSKAEPKEFPIPLVEEYSNNCDRLKKYEGAVIKRFAPKLQDIQQEFIRLTYVFNESFLPEYAALAYMGAARCEKIQDRHMVERHYLLKAAEAFLKAYNRRLKLGYRDGEDEYRQGALRCYDEILQNPHLPKNSFIRASVIRQLKTIEPYTDQTSTFESPLLRYEDLKRAAIVDIKNEHYTNALNKLTDISDDIVERKKGAFHAAVLEYAEITRLLLLLHLEMPPAALAPSNAALLERYRLNLEVLPTTRAKESALDPELFLMFRALVIGIQSHSIPFIRDAFDDLGRLEFLSPEQHKLLRLVFYKYKDQFEVEEVEKECKCFKFYDSSSSDDEVEEEVKLKLEAEETVEEPLSPELEELARDLDEMEERHRTFTALDWYNLVKEAEETASDEVKRMVNPNYKAVTESPEEVPTSTDQGQEPEVKEETKDWVDPLSQPLEPADDEEEGAVGGRS